MTYWLSFYSFLLALLTINVDATNITRRYEYLFSFKPPMLAQKNGAVPFFEHGGQAIASPDSIRLTPSMVDKQGWVWSKKKANFSAFEVEFTFRVTGRGRIGADGLAFWYVTDKSQGGPVYGAADKWTGLGIFFDTYDNDAARNNPIVMAILNDGSKEYLHELDGEGQQLGKCLRDFRNRPVPIRVKIQYSQGALEVSVGHGMVDKEQDVDLCFVMQNINLPAEGYFGLSAATGGLADDHDVYRMEVHSLHSQLENQTLSEGPSDSDRQKLEKEFDEYYEKLRKAEEEFKKEEEAKAPKDRKNKKNKLAEDSWTDDESESNRNLRQIWESQNTLLQFSRETSQKLDTFSEQLRAVSSASHDTKLPTDVASKEDLKYQMDLVQNSLQGLRKLNEEVKTNLASIDDHKQRETPYDQLKFHNELRDAINDVRDRVVEGNKQLEEHLRGLVQQEVSRLSNNVVRECSLCLPTQLFIITLFMQSGLLVAFLIYQHRKGNEVKKFY